jgi:Raf kinase inhibitor-like YbhB/YbcL family protein
MAVASLPLAFVALTMCSSNDSATAPPDAGSASAAGDGGGQKDSGSGQKDAGSGGGTDSGRADGGDSGAGPEAGDDASGGDDGGGSPEAGGPFTLTGSDFAMMGTRLCFKAGQTKNTGNMSPPLAWSGAPAGTQSFAVSLTDTSNGNTHWVMWDIPSTETALAAGLPTGVIPGPPAPAGSMQRGASFAGGTTNPGYFGPGAGSPARAYALELWAMNVATLNVPGTEAVNTMVSTRLPANSIASTKLTVYGDQDANCQ